MTMDPRLVMADIETVGVEPGAAIVAIGAIEFNERCFGETWSASISLTSCTEAGLTIDGQTLEEFWLEQDEDVLTQLGGGEPIADVLERFADWADGADEIWANAPKFDCAMLEKAGEAVGVEMPWTDYDLRDVRTVKHLPGAEMPDRTETKHDAVADARYQAMLVQATLAELH